MDNSSHILKLKTKLWQFKEGDQQVTDYYNEMIALWQELDLCYDEEWDCTKDSATHLRRKENGEWRMTGCTSS